MIVRDCDAMQASVDGRDVLAGVGFSGWAGEGRRAPRNRSRSAAQRLDSNVFDMSDTDFSVYDKDITTLRLVSNYAWRWQQVKASATLPA